MLFLFSLHLLFSQILRSEYMARLEKAKIEIERKKNQVFETISQSYLDIYLMF